MQSLRWNKLALPLMVAAGAVFPAAGQQHHVAPPAAACTSETRVTPSETSGPFYKSGSPERVSLLEPNMAGTKLIVTGYVLSRGDCKPVARAWLDFWQASDSGVYDNTATGCAAISSRTALVSTTSRPSCRASTRAARATFT